MLPSTSQLLDLACYIVQHIDFSQDPDRAAVLHDDQCIPGGQRRHRLFDRGVGREDCPGVLHKRVDRLFVTVIVFFQHVVQQIDFFEHPDQFPAGANHRHLRNPVLVHDAHDVTD